MTTYTQAQDNLIQALDQVKVCQVAVHAAREAALQKIEEKRILASYTSASGHTWYLIKALSRQQAQKIDVWSCTKSNYLSDLHGKRIYPATTYEGHRLTEGYWFVQGGITEGTPKAIDCFKYPDPA